MGKGQHNPDQRLRYQSSVDRIWARFAPADLATVCAMDEEDFPLQYGMEVFDGLAQRAPNDWFAFKDNGSDILAVAHLDTVADEDARRANFVNTEAGPVVFSRALDDRLGAYTILELLPKLGINFDILLTVGEEMGQSTAGFFSTTKKYKWIIEFDRGGTDCVLYQYENQDMRSRVIASGARVGKGSYSDISYMSQVGAKGINWGVGYRDYHTAKSHAYLDDYVEMIAYFLEFHRQNRDVTLPHDEKDEEDAWGWSGSKRTRPVGGLYGYGGAWLGDDELDDDDIDDEIRFAKWLADRKEYTPDATCPGTASPLFAVGPEVDDDIIDDRIEATVAQAPTLPGLDDLPESSLLSGMLRRS